MISLFQLLRNLTLFLALQATLVIPEYLCYLNKIITYLTKSAFV